MTPEQMRALADEAWRTADGLVDTDPIALRELSYRQATTLRAAANQLEAVLRLTELTPVMIHPLTKQVVDVVYVSDLVDALSTIEPDAL